MTACCCLPPKHAKRIKNCVKPVLSERYRNIIEVKRFGLRRRRRRMHFAVHALL